MPQDGCPDPHCSPDSPVGHTSPLGTATPSAPRAPRHHGSGHTRHHSTALPCGNAAASPPAGTMRLAPEPSAAGHWGCGEELPLPPLFTIFSHPLCPTLVLGAAQLCALAAAARLPAAAVSVIPAPHALLPGWCGRRGPCEAAGLLLHVGPGMTTGTGMHLSPPSVLGAHPAPLHTLLPWPSLGQQLRRQRGTAWLLPQPRHSPAASVRHSGMHRCWQHVSGCRQSPSPRQLFPWCRSAMQAAVGLGQRLPCTCQGVPTAVWGSSAPGTQRRPGCRSPQSFTPALPGSPSPWLPAPLGGTAVGTRGGQSCRSSRAAPTRLTLAVCVALLAAPLVTAHLGWGTVLVLAAPLLVVRLRGGWGRAGIL